MFKNESDFKKLVDQLDIEAKSNPAHRQNLRRQMLSVFNETRQSQRLYPVATGVRRIVARTILHSRITKVAAAVIALALLVPLTYGTAAIIKSLVGTVEADSFKGRFTLDRDIHINLQVGTKQEHRIVTAGDIRFFKEGEQLLGTLRCSVSSWPKFTWRTRVVLLTVEGDVLTSTEHVRENGGVNPTGHAHWCGLSVHFSLCSWHDVSQAEAFRVSFERVPDEMETTADAWVESTQLPVVHGRVTDPHGEPIANATVQIREERKPGQLNISAPDVRTDKRGYYSFDGIEWPYRVGVLVYAENPSSEGYRHQYMRFNKVLEGSQEVDFNFGPFPKGNAILSGQVVEPNGTVIEEFNVDVRLNVDWKDYSIKYLYQFGIKNPFVASDGRFEIADLPAGVYKVSVIPTKNEVIDLAAYTGIRHYLCDLVDGERMELSEQHALEKVWYGRVLFDDGAPAVLDLPAVRAHIIKWEEGFPEGQTLATVDGEGYFAACISDEVMERLLSGRAWLTIAVSHSVWRSHIQKDKFPAELLSLHRDKAGAVRVTRPHTYYGRILYENGRPAVPEVMPWPGAKVYVAIRYTPATATDGGLTEELGDIDSQGYFAVCLTDEQLERLRSGTYQIGVAHPSYEDAMTTYGMGTFPCEILATEASQAKGYRLPYEKMSCEFRNLKQQLESADKLKELNLALSAYCADHADTFPIMLEELRPYDVNDLLTWLKENVEYLGAGQVGTAQQGEEIAVAYDKALLDKTERRGTNVLFMDEHVEFCRAKRLQRLGIDCLEE